MNLNDTQMVSCLWSASEAFRMESELSCLPVMGENAEMPGMMMPVMLSRSVRLMGQCAN